MREILFRGRDKEGCWNFGNLVHLRCEVRGEATTEVFKIHPIKINGAEYPTVVDPETVGQYTGLEDKNGKKIFEGDILLLPGFCMGEEYIAESKAVVVWHDGGWELQEITENSPAYVLDHDSATDMEVVGNIYDNPELTEE